MPQAHRISTETVSLGLVSVCVCVEHVPGVEAGRRSTMTILAAVVDARSVGPWNVFGGRQMWSSGCHTLAWPWAHCPSYSCMLPWYPPVRTRMYGRVCAWLLPESVVWCRRTRRRTFRHCRGYHGTRGGWRTDPRVIFSNRTNRHTVDSTAAFHCR